MARERKIDDAGAKIGGARKDWNRQPLSEADLAVMTDAEIALEVTKESIWPKPDYGALVEAGMPVKVAALVKVLRDGLPQKPCRSSHKSEQDRRKAFHSIMSEVRDRAMAAKSAEDLVDIAQSVNARAVAEQKDKSSDKTHLNALHTIMRARTSPLSLSWKQRSKANDLVEAGFPDAKASPLSGATFVPVGNGHVRIIKNKKFIGDKFTSEAEARAWLIETGGKVETNNAKPIRKKVPERPHLDHLVRQGLTDHRDGQDITPEQFIDHFGFRGVEFGEWLPDSERQQVINRGFDALMDLAEVLGLEPGQVSLGGSLAIAFGARGQGGRAAAHYEPGRRVINLTRLSGAGTLAHEYGHALDHYLGDGTSVSVPGGIASVTGWDFRLSPEQVVSVLAHHDEDVANSWSEVVKSLTHRQRTASELQDHIVGNLQKMDLHIKTATENLEQFRASGRPGLAINERKFNTWLADVESRKKLLMMRLDELSRKAPDEEVGNRQTDYVNEALKITGRNGYWSKPCELFARAFEAYVFDELDASASRSDYLVHSVSNEFYDEELSKGKPYPEGQEREAIVTAMRRAMAVTVPVIKSGSDVSRTPVL